VPGRIVGDQYQRIVSCGENSPVRPQYGGPDFVRWVALAASCPGGPKLDHGASRQRPDSGAGIVGLRFRSCGVVGVKVSIECQRSSTGQQSPSLLIIAVILVYVAFCRCQFDAEHPLRYESFRRSLGPGGRALAASSARWTGVQRCPRCRQCNLLRTGGEWRLLPRESPPGATSTTISEAGRAQASGPAWNVKSMSKRAWQLAPRVSLRCLGSYRPHQVRARFASVAPHWLEGSASSKTREVRHAQ
jgi:hypothetical protein